MKEISVQCEVCCEFSCCFIVLINNVVNYFGICKVLVELFVEIVDRIDQFDVFVCEKFFLWKVFCVVWFYIKGGNVFDVIMVILCGDYDFFGVGKLDWDIQVIIDLWLFVIIQNSLYGDIEDILIDVLWIVGFKVVIVINVWLQDVLLLCFVIEVLFVDVIVNYMFVCDLL